MGDEIEVGEYVRTNYGEIHKVIEIKDDEEGEEEWNFYKFENDMGIFKKYITKHSKNIIDLIEVGDILELREYIDIFKKSEKLGVSDWSMLNEISQGIKEKKIELISILTHEQYENGCFRLEDNDDC